MTEISLVVELTVLVLAIFLGFEVISKVPTMLHTPLMSGTNFIHGIVVVGALLILGTADDTLLKIVGFEVISKVPTMLHTPLMSGTNAIHGIVLVGAIIVAGLPHQATWIHVVALAAVALATMNVVGGFVVTDRMLHMFKRRQPERREPDESG